MIKNNVIKSNLLPECCGRKRKNKATNLKTTPIPVATAIIPQPDGYVLGSKLYSYGSGPYPNYSGQGGLGPRDASFVEMDGTVASLLSLVWPLCLKQ